MKNAPNPVEDFRNLVADNIRKLGEDRDFIGLSNIWIREAVRHSYALNFSWLGRPTIQIPLGSLRHPGTDLGLPSRPGDRDRHCSWRLLGEERVNAGATRLL
jgi:hypothetical protein